MRLDKSNFCKYDEIPNDEIDVLIEIPKGSNINMERSLRLEF
jgi:inorganic pyrophosphatase